MNTWEVKILESVRDGLDSALSKLNSVCNDDSPMDEVKAAIGVVVATAMDASNRISLLIGDGDEVHE